MQRRLGPRPRSHRGYNERNNGPLIGLLNACNTPFRMMNNCARQMKEDGVINTVIKGIPAATAGFAIGCYYNTTTMNKMSRQSEATVYDDPSISQFTGTTNQRTDTSAVSMQSASTQSTPWGTGERVDLLLEQQNNPLVEEQYHWLRDKHFLVRDEYAEGINSIKSNWPCFWGVHEVMTRTEDGAKWTCGLNDLAHLPEQECIVYSFGSANNWVFEEGVLEMVPHCKVFTFDPTIGVDQAHPPQSITDRLEFRQWGLAGKDEGNMKLLSTVMKELGHDHIDILKVDVEGWEFPAFFALDERNEWPSFGQLLIELHADATRGYVPSELSGVDPEDEAAMLFHIIGLFEKHSLRMFHDEVNWMGAQCCSEYSFIQKHWEPTRRNYKDTA